MGVVAMMRVMTMMMVTPARCQSRVGADESKNGDKRKLLHDLEASTDPGRGKSSSQRTDTGWEPSLQPFRKRFPARL